MERGTKEELFKKIKNHRVISVVGLSKNVGKTTVVNFLLRRLCRACVMTIGRDGEDQDAIFNVAKPKILLPKDDFAIVPVAVLPEWGEIYETFEASSGKVALVKAKIDTEVQTIKVGSYEETLQISQKLTKYCDHIIVDGALERIGIASYVDAAILVSGAEVGRTTEKIVEKTVKIIKRIQTPMVEEKISLKLKGLLNKVVSGKDGKIFALDVNGVAGYEDKIVKLCEDSDFVYLPGAVTDKIASKLKCEIIVPNSGNILCDEGNFKVLAQTNLLGIGVNHTSIKGVEVDPEELIFELRRRLNGIIIFDVLYEEVSIWNSL